MKGFNDRPVSRACSERQVLLYSTDWEEPLPETMEEIKISIVNDLAAGSKRGRDNEVAVTPSAKRSRHAVFSCSTPISASARTWATQSILAEDLPQFPAWHSQGEDAEQGDENDDSLLEPSDNEDDSELLMTLDEINTLLGVGEEENEEEEKDDDDDSCFAAEPLQKETEVTTFVVTFTPSESKNEVENGENAPCKTLDVPGPLTEESEGDEELSTYAAMPPSPCHSAIDPVEATEPNQSSVCNVDPPREFLTDKTDIDCDLPTPLSDLKEASTSLLPNSHTPKLPLQPSILLSGVDAAVNWSEDPDLAFDCDIDNLLAISPGGASLVEDDNNVKLATVITEVINSAISDSALPQQDVKSEQVLTDVAQDLSLPSPGLPKIHHHHHHPPVEPEPSKDALPSPTASIVTAEPKLGTESSVTYQNVENQKPPEAEETKGMQNAAKATSRPAEPSTSAAAPRANGNQPKIVASLTCKTEGSSGPGKKPQIAVAAVPRQLFRAFIPDPELETNKAIYMDQVLMHIDSQGECNLEDPRYELATLFNQTSRENRNWQHPSDYTKRNHPRFGTIPLQSCSLNLWVKKNGGPKQRFMNIPSSFQRSPIPEVLPYSS